MKNLQQLAYENDLSIQGGILQKQQEELANLQAKETELKHDLRDIETQLDYWKNTLRKGDKEIKKTRTNYAKKIYAKRLIGNLVGVDFATPSVNKMHGEKDYKSTERKRKQIRQKLSVLNQKIASLAKEIQMLKQKQAKTKENIAASQQIIQKTQKDIADNEQLMQEMENVLWPIKSLEKVYTWSEKEKVLLAKVDLIVWELQNIPQTAERNSKNRLRELLGDEFVKTCWVLVARLSGLSSFLVENKHIINYPCRTLHLNLEKRHSDELLSLIDKHFPTLFKDQTDNWAAVLEEIFFKPLFENAKDIKFVEKTADFICKFPYIKSNYTKEWKLLAKRFSNVLLSSDPYKLSNIGLWKEYKKILPSEVYDTLWNDIKKIPISYWMVEEIYNEAVKNYKYLSYGGVRMDIKSEKFKILAMRAKIQNNSEIYDAIIKIINAALQIRHTDGTNSIYFIDATNDILQDVLYKELAPKNAS